MASKQKNVERIKVYVRFKPLKSEKLRPIDYSLKNNENGTHTLYLKNTDSLARNQKNLAFIFDEIFPSNTSQSMIFEKVASPMIDKFVQKGVNCTIFSYGQTGSGKTYTICGLKQVNDRGIIHQTFGRLFDHVQASSSGEKYEIQVSFIEIYIDKIRDLTKSKSDSNVIHRSTYIKRINIKNEFSAIRLFEKIKLRRKTSATNKNEHSSRSHLICTIHLTKYDHMLKTYDAEFNLVDLAGSESYDDMIENQITEFESRAVNQSLYYLRQVTKKLADPNYKGNIPYRNSKLTWALENTLGGQCRVAMIANVDSHDKCLKESINTFEFATEIASIKKCIANTIKRAPYKMNYDQSKNIGKTFENRKTKYEYTETKNENTKTKIKNLMTEHALLKKSYDLLRKNHDSSKLRTKQIILSVMKQLAEHCTTLNNIDDMIVFEFAAKNAFPTKHEFILLESVGESSVMQEDKKNDVKSTTESNSHLKHSMFARLDKLNTVGAVLGIAVGVLAVFGTENVVSAAVGLGIPVVSVTKLRNVISAVFGHGSVVMIVATILNCWIQQLS